MLESELTSVLITGASTLIYIAGLVGFVTWLKSKDGKQEKAPAAKETGNLQL